jgi:hypothetical protein
MSLLVGYQVIYIQKQPFRKEDLPQLGIHPGLPGLFDSYGGNLKTIAKGLLKE